jgi:hypothetical protein
LSSELELLEAVMPGPDDRSTMLLVPLNLQIDWDRSLQVVRRAYTGRRAIDERRVSSVGRRDLFVVRMEES